MEELGFVSVFFYCCSLTVLVELDSSKLIGLVFEKKTIIGLLKFIMVCYIIYHFLFIVQIREHFRLCR